MTKQQLIDELNRIYAQLMVGDKVYAIGLLFSLILHLKNVDITAE